MHESTLVSLAILKVNWDSLGHDYVESFVPFAVECIRRSSDDVVSLQQLREKLASEFGLNIPLNPLRMILVRATKRGYLRREHGAFYRNLDKCNEIGFRERQIKVEGIYDTIVDKIIKYSKDKHSLDWTRDLASETLHSFLRDNSLSLLFTVAEGGIISGPRGISGPGFILGSFITESQTTDKQVIDDIVTLIQGNLLTNALYLPDPGRVQQRFKNTRVYIDTSILAYAAGYAGPALAAPSLELIDLLKLHGAETLCFQHTKEELVGILDACASRLRQGRLRDSFGPSMEYFIETGRTASDVELMAARVNDKLRSIGITIDEKPPYEKEFQIDETGLEAALEAEIHYIKPKARVNDVDSISAIARLRRGRESFSPETSWALFVTTNTALAKVTRNFFQSDSPPGAVALCMSDYALGNLLWLKNPTNAPDLPRKQLLAHAFAALQPPEHLWKKYLIETARLQDQGKISSDEYYVLRHSLAAKSALMDLTHGVETAFSEGTVREVLSIVKENLQADLKEVIKREQESRHVAENRIQEFEEERSRRTISLRLLATQIARTTRNVLIVIASIIILFGIFYTFPWKFPYLTAALGKYVTSAILLLLLLLSFSNLFRGITISSIADNFEKKLSEKLQKWFLQFAGLG